MKLKGIVLAGGQSSRFGEDKALALHDGITLLEHAVNVLTALKLDPAVIACPEKNYTFLNRPVHHDVVPQKGPMGGLLTAFLIYPESDLLVLTCDMPFLNPSVLGDLVCAYRASGRPTVFEIGGAQQPFPGIYPSACKEAAQTVLSSDRCSLRHYLALLPNLQILPEPPDPLLFKNVNTPADLSRV